MTMARRGFYLIIGFTFPGFWMLHAAGYFWAALYHPIMAIFKVTSTGWPAFITALFLYGGLIFLFEVTLRFRPSSEGE